MDKLKKILIHLGKLGWKCDLTDEKIIKIAKRNLKLLTINATKNQKYFRLTGQSGSGKTSQGLVPIKLLCEQNNISPIHLAVRNFAPLHPNYKSLLKKFGKQLIREKTNGFALKLLVVSLYFLLQNKYDILLEMALITRKFESFLLKELKENSYKNLYFIFAVNKTICKKFIEKRKNSSNNNETSRIILKSSQKFFNFHMKNSLKFLSKKDKLSSVIIWSFANLLPFYQGNMQTSFKPYKACCKEKNIIYIDENKLLNSKIEFVKTIKLN